MATKIEIFNQSQLKKDIPDINPGDTVKIHQKIKEKDKYRIQIFEGVILARKHGKGVSSTFTVRKILSGVGVEKVFPLHSPLIDKIEIVKRGKARRAKLYFLRTAKGKKSRLKRKETIEVAGKSEDPVSEEKTE